MNGLASPKAKRRLWWTALRKLQLRADYHATACLANIFGWPFWFFESHRARLADRIENQRSTPQ
jgi:hypothetical protein